MGGPIPDMLRRTSLPQPLPHFSVNGRYLGEYCDGSAQSLCTNSSRVLSSEWSVTSSTAERLHSRLFLIVENYAVTYMPRSVTTSKLTPSLNRPGRSGPIPTTTYLDRLVQIAAQVQMSESETRRWKQNKRKPSSEGVISDLTRGYQKPVPVHPSTNQRDTPGRLPSSCRADGRISKHLSFRLPPSAFSWSWRMR